VKEEEGKGEGKEEEEEEEEEEDIYRSVTTKSYKMFQKI
jgi:hypothetical protein